MIPRNSRGRLSFVARWFMYLPVVAGLMAQVPAEWKMVSVADRAELYEIDSSGELTFTLRNQMDLQLERYAVEVWTKADSGQLTRWCSFSDVHAAIGRAPQVLRQSCQVPVDARSGKAVFHSSRIVELDWEHGVRWRPALNMAAHPRS